MVGLSVMCNLWILIWICLNIPNIFLQYLFCEYWQHFVAHFFCSLEGTKAQPCRVYWNQKYDPDKVGHEWILNFDSSPMVFMVVSLSYQGHRHIKISCI